MASNGRRNARENSKEGFEKRQKRRQIRVLQEAVDKNDADRVCELLQEDFDVDFQYRSQTALQQAVRLGHADICRLLIDKGANVNMADAEHNNLLNMACSKGYLEIAKLLVQHSANIDDENMQGFSSIHTCADKGHVDILQILITAGGNPDVATMTGITALHTAVRLDREEVVQLLLLGGCQVDKTDENRKTPLMLAAELGRTDIAHILINGGADVNKQDRTGSSPLYIAVHHGHINVVQLLVTSGADINLPSTKGLSPLLESIQCAHTDISLFLIDSQCDVDQMDRLKEAPIHSAVSKVSQFFSEETGQAMLLIHRLVDAGCNLNVTNQQGHTPLYQSACGGNAELTKYLLTQAVDVTIQTNTGDTILHGGVHGNQVEVVKLLIEADCALNEKNNAGEHALLTAVVYHAQIGIVEALIKAGSNLNIKDKASANAALHNAILHYYADAAHLLIDNGCDINTLNSKRLSPLYLACEKNDDTIARKILTHPKFSRRLFQIPNIPQPMTAAIKNGHVHLVDLLIQAGYNIDMISIDGTTPVQLALEENKIFIVQLLLKYNCDLDAHAKVKRLLKCCLLHDDSHPHFDLEPLFLSLTHRKVEMLQLLIDCYWQVPMKTISTMEKVFHSTPDLSSHYSAELKQEILDVFRLAISVPRNLQASCRAVVRERLGSGLASKVLDLPVANKLKDYILMEEFFGDLDTSIKLSEKAHPTDFQGFRSSVDWDENDFDSDDGVDDE